VAALGRHLDRRRLGLSRERAQSYRLGAQARIGQMQIINVIARVA
jgi:hypothetical protein